MRLADGEGLSLSRDATRVLLRVGNALMNAPIGTGTPVPVALGPVVDIDGAAFLPDGKRFLLGGAEKGKGPRLWLVDPPALPRAISPEGTLGGGTVSPDGRWVVSWSADSSILSLLPIDGGPIRPLPGTEHDDILGWTPDGRALYVRPSPGEGARVSSLDLKTLVRTPVREFAPPDPTSVTAMSEPAFASDGSAYAYTYARVLTSDLYVVEGLK